MSSEFSTVTVQFFGVCTHFPASALAPLGPVPPDFTHRVVLVNASDPRKLDHIPAGVQPHVARLQLRKADLVAVEARDWFPITFEDEETIEWHLGGVSITLGKEVIPLSAPPLPTNCIPSLSRYADNISGPGEMTVTADASKAACYFDFVQLMHLTGQKIEPGDAAAGLVEITSSTGGTDIVVTQFGTGDTVTLTVKPGTPITVSNIPEEPKNETDVDFLLHFVTLAQFPADPRFPTKGEMVDNCPSTLKLVNPPRFLADITTPSCSNSLYP